MKKGSPGKGPAHPKDVTTKTTNAKPAKTHGHTEQPGGGGNPFTGSPQGAPDEPIIRTKRGGR